MHLDFQCKMISGRDVIDHNFLWMDLDNLTHSHQSEKLIIMEATHLPKSPNQPLDHPRQIDPRVACDATSNNRQINSADRQTTSHINADNNTWTAIKNIPKKISIYCRAITRVAILGCYYIKHKVLKCSLTPEQYESCLRTLGPVISEFARLTNFDITRQNLRLTAEDTNAFEQVMARSERNLNDISYAEACQILKSSFGDKYKIHSYLKTTQTATWFEVKSKGVHYTAKVTTSKHLDEIAIGTMAMKMMALFSSTISDRFAAQTLSNFYQEKSLISEGYFHNKFQDTVTSNPEVQRFKCSDDNAVLSLHIPEVVDQSASKNVMIVADVGLGYTIQELSASGKRAEALRSKLFRQCFGRDPKVDESLTLIEHIHDCLKNKWMKLAHSSGLVHLDFNPQNLVLNFQPGGIIHASIKDMENCYKFPEHDRKVISDLHDLAFAVNPHNLDESVGFMHNKSLQNLFSFFENQLQTQSARSHFRANRATIMLSMGQAFKSLQRRSATAGSDLYKGNPAVFAVACDLAKNHGVELPANTALFALGLIRLWETCYPHN